MSDNPARSVPLGRAGAAITMVDASDYEWVTQWTWFLTAVGYVARWESRREAPRRQRYLHRELLGLTHGDKREADHINGDKLDNRQANLRIVTRAQNAQNMPDDGTRGIRPSVTPGRWCARYKLNGRERWLGTFDSREEAAAAVRAARKEAMTHASR